MMCRIFASNIWSPTVWTRRVQERSRGFWFRPWCCCALGHVGFSMVVLRLIMTGTMTHLCDSLCFWILWFFSEEESQGLLRLVSYLTVGEQEADTLCQHLACPQSLKLWNRQSILSRHGLGLFLEDPKHMRRAKHEAKSEPSKAHFSQEQLQSKGDKKEQRGIEHDRA